MSLPEHRAGDADRDRVAELLREAHAEGRIDVDELTQRLDATYRARTYGDLAALTVDLPTSRRGSRPPATPPPTRPPDTRGAQKLRAAWTAYAVAVSVNVVIWFLVSLNAGEAIYFWPMWVAGPWGVVLLVSTVARRFGR